VTRDTESVIADFRSFFEGYVKEIIATETARFLERANPVVTEIADGEFRAHYIAEELRLDLV
jgi:hypothetical protein